MLLNGANVVNRHSELEDQVSLTIFKTKHTPSVATTRVGRVRPPLPLYIGLKLHALTRSKDLMNSFCKLGISVSYDCD